ASSMQSNIIIVRLAIRVDKLRQTGSTGLSIHNDSRPPARPNMTRYPVHGTPGCVPASQSDNGFISPTLRRQAVPGRAQGLLDSTNVYKNAFKDPTMSSTKKSRHVVQGFTAASAQKAAFDGGAIVTDVEDQDAAVIQQLERKLEAGCALGPNKQSHGRRGVDSTAHLEGQVRQLQSCLAAREQEVRGLKHAHDDLQAKYKAVAAERDGLAERSRLLGEMLVTFAKKKNRRNGLLQRTLDLQQEQVELLQEQLRLLRAERSLGGAFQAESSD
ncbi:hypothetical protein Agub_g4633, partial [Astrephomene gubernaculifera]